MADPDTPFHNPGGHAPGEVNVPAWEKADIGRRIVRARRLAKALDTREARIDLASVEQEGIDRVQDIVQGQADRAALARDTQENLLTRQEFDDRVLSRLRKLQDLKPGTPEFYRAHRVQPPEPVMVSYAPSQDEGKARVASRVWAVDSDDWVDRYGVTPHARFGKLAGQEMTDAEYRFVSRAMYPVNWDKDGEPVAWDAAHDGRDMPEISKVGSEIDLTEATPEEREAAKQYATTGYIPGGTGDPEIEPTEHVILPDPPAETTE